MDNNQKGKKASKYSYRNVRNQKLIGSSLEAEIYIYLGDNLQKAFKNIEIKKILMVSKFIFLDKYG